MLVSLSFLPAVAGGCVVFFVTGELLESLATGEGMFSNLLRREKVCFRNAMYVLTVDEALIIIGKAWEAFSVATFLLCRADINYGDKSVLYVFFFSNTYTSITYLVEKWKQLFHKYMDSNLHLI